MRMIVHHQDPVFAMSFIHNDLSFKALVSNTQRPIPAKPPTGS
jgi:hypothetical protein